MVLLLVVKWSGERMSCPHGKFSLDMDHTGGRHCTTSKFGTFHVGNSGSTGCPGSSSSYGLFAKVGNSSYPTVGHFTNVENKGSQPCTEAPLLCR